MSRCLALLILAAFSTQPPLSKHELRGDSAQQSNTAATSHATTVPDWLPIRLPVALYEKWRKYGTWDYKQQGFQYRQFTQFNFGATGSAAGLDKSSLLALAQASKPTPDDVKRLDDPELLINFNRNSDGFDSLLAMAGQNIHLIRIADDYTWLDNDTKWPRPDVGLTPQRWNEYRQLFEKLSLAEGILRSPDFPGAIFFISRARGLCTGGSSSGYVYSADPLTPATQSPAKDLDAEARKNPKQNYAYVFKPLKPNWYAFYEIDW